MEELDPLPPDNADVRSLVETTPAGVASTEALRAIIARHNRWRVRTLTLALVAVLVAGPLIGYTVGQQRTTRGTSVASGANRAEASQQSQGAPAPEVAGTGSAAIGSGQPGHATQLFLRDTSDGVRIRAYVTTFAGVGAGAVNGVAGPDCRVATGGFAPPCPSPIPTPCPSVTTLEAQVSNDQVAGVTQGEFTGSAGALDVIEATVIGAGDPTPIGTVLVHTGAGVSRVRLVVPGGGVDEMAPRQQLAILAHGVVFTPGAPPQPVPLTSVPAQGEVAPSGGAATQGGATTPSRPPPESTTPPGAPVPPPLVVPAQRYFGYGFPPGTKVEAFGARGNVLASVALPGGASFSPTFACAVEPPGISLPAQPTVPSGSAGSGGASSGTATSGRATSTGG